MTTSKSPHEDNILLPIITVAGLPLLGAVVLFLVFMYGLESGSVPREKLEQIQPGNPLAEVQALLGDPAEISTNQNGAVVWVYKKPFRWRFIKITSVEDRVVRIIQE